MDQKKKFIILISAVTAVISVLLFMAGFHYNASTKAEKILYDEIADIQENSAVLNDEKTELSQQLDDISKQLEESNTENEEYIEYQNKNEELSASIAELEKQIEDIDKQLSSKKNTASSSAKSPNKETGASYPLAKDESYTCPEEVPEGRYRATGKGTLIIYSDGKVKTQENLDVAPDNSYTFTLEDGQRVKVTGDITLIELQ